MDKTDFTASVNECKDHESERIFNIFIKKFSIHILIEIVVLCNNCVKSRNSLNLNYNW